MTAALRVTCLFILALLTASAQQTTPQTVLQKFRISGTVVNGVTDQPLADALVEIGLAQKQEAARSVQTDDAGRFAFEGLAPAKYWLVGERQGFQRQGYNEHSSFFTAIVVGPGLQSEDIVFRLRPDASISGIVTDEQNEPIRDAQVHLFVDGSEEGERRTSQRGQARTDSDGHYRFSHLRPGRYFVAVSAHPWYAQNQQPQAVGAQSGGSDGTAGDTAQGESSTNRSPLDVAYPITYYAGAVAADYATPIVLKAGDRAKADITLSAVPALHLRIATAGMNSSPNSGVGANVSGRAPGGASIPVQAPTISAAGEMEITGIAPGDYELSLNSFGKESHNWIQSVRLTEDAEIDGLRSRTPASVTGVVTLDGVRVSARPYVSLRDPASGAGFGTQVNAKGEFDFESQAVKAGTYQVAVFNIQNLNSQGAAVTALTASGARVSGHSVTVEDGATVKLEVSMSKGLGEVNGVAERDGNPLAGAMIVLIPEKMDGNESLFRRDQSDSDGSFTFRGIVPGKYTVVALEHGWELEWSKAEVLRPYLTNGESVEVVATGKYQVKVKVQ